MYTRLWATDHKATGTLNEGTGTVENEWHLLGRRAPPPQKRNDSSVDAEIYADSRSRFIDTRPAHFSSRVTVPVIWLGQTAPARTVFIWQFTSLGRK